MSNGNGNTPATPARAALTAMQQGHNLVTTPDFQAQTKKALLESGGVDLGYFQLSAETYLAEHPDLLRANGLGLEILRCARYGLYLDGARNMASIVVYAGKATLLPGYLGMILMMERESGLYEMHAEVAYKGEKYKVTKGTSRGIVHEVDQDCRVNDKGNNLVGAYVTYRVPGIDEIQFHELGRSEILRIRDNYSKNKGNWDRHPEPFWKKTVIKDLRKYRPGGRNLDKLMRVDNAVIMDQPLPPEEKDITGQVNQSETRGAASLEDQIEGDK